MHTFLLFFAWPGGAVWGNVGAMPLCGTVAAVTAFFFRDHLGRALRSWWHRHLGHRAELEEIRAALDGHADLLSLDTPGGLAAVLDEVKRARAAAESALAGVQMLTSATPMKPAATKKEQS